MVILASKASRTRIAVAIGALAGFGLIAFLFLAGSTITFKSVDAGEPTMTVKCSSLVVFFQDQHYYDDIVGNGSYRPQYATVSGSEPSGPATDPLLPGREIDAVCAQHQSAWAGLIGVLAAPTAVLALISVAAWRPAASTGDQVASTARS